MSVEISQYAESGTKTGTAVERVEVLAAGPDVPRSTWADMPPVYMTQILVRVTDAEGAQGIGATQAYGGGGFDLSTYEGVRALAPMLVGRDAQMRERLWNDLRSLVLPSAPGSVAPLDIALWDLAARRAGLPLHRFLGASRDRVPAYASTSQLDTVGDYIELVARLREEGFRAVKFHAWNIPDRDLEMLRKVHATYGDSGLTFMHDAENRYDRPSAYRVARELDEMGYRWFEAPLIDYDIDAYVDLRRRVNIPIVPHGLWIEDLRALNQALRRAPWDAVRFDVTLAGGFTGARKLLALAEAYGLPVEPQSWGYTLVQAANLHLGLATANTTYFESPLPYEAFEYGVGNPIRVDADGDVRAPAGPGLGIDVDWTAWESASLAGWDSAAD